jgi:hypothetical protein
VAASAQSTGGPSRTHVGRCIGRTASNGRRAANSQSKWLRHIAPGVKVIIQILRISGYPEQWCRLCLCRPTEDYSHKWAASEEAAAPSRGDHLSCPWIERAGRTRAWASRRQREFLMRRQPGNGTQAVGSEEMCVAGGLTWRKSSWSHGGENECVEVAQNEISVLVRDSRYPQGAVLAFGYAAWCSFLADERSTTLRNGPAHSPR